MEIFLLISVFFLIIGIASSVVNLTIIYFKKFLRNRHIEIDEKDEKLLVILDDGIRIPLNDFIKRLMENKA